MWPSWWPRPSIATPLTSWQKPNCNPPKPFDPFGSTQKKHTFGSTPMARRPAGRWKCEDNAMTDFRNFGGRIPWAYPWYVQAVGVSRGGSQHDSKGLRRETFLSTQQETRKKTWPLPHKGFQLMTLYVFKTFFWSLFRYDRGWHHLHSALPVV